MRLLYCLLLLALFSLPCWAGIRVTVEMRDTAYTLGDLISERVVIALPAGQAIAPDSLPPPGRAAPWLELRTVRLLQDGDVARLDLEWQVFATVESPQILKIPAIELRTQGKHPQAVDIPAQLFHQSPVLPSLLENRTPRPDLPPLLFDERPLALAALACFVCTLLCGVAWLWLTDRIPGLPRHPGPFTRLARHLPRRKGDLDVAALRDIHTALNAAAGETLYPATLPRLFERAPYLEPIRADMERFFRTSWKRFYESAPTTPNWTETLLWVKRAARAERIARR
jgi:mxaA protein